MAKKNRWWLPHMVAFVVVVVWGSTFVFTKLLLLDGLSAAQVFTLRFIIAYVLLTAFSLCKSGRMKWLAHSWKDELLLAALGVTGGSLYFLTENEALNYTTTTNVSLIVCCCPLVAALLIGLFYKTQRMNVLQSIGTLLAAIGVAVVVLNGHFVLHLSPVGDLLALTANVCWALYSLFMVGAMKRYDSLFITRKVFFYGLLTILPYFAANPSWPSLQQLSQPRTLGCLLYLGVVASMVCFLVWTWVMKQIGAVVATNYVYINPLATIIFARIILGEQITLFFVLGTFLILTGMYLAAAKPSAK